MSVRECVMIVDIDELMSPNMRRESKYPQIGAINTTDNDHSPSGERETEREISADGEYISTDIVVPGMGWWVNTCLK